MYHKYCVYIIWVAFKVAADVCKPLQLLNK